MKNKKFILRNLQGYTLEEVLIELKDLNQSRVERLLKEYTLEEDIKEKMENVTKEDMTKNYYTLGKIRAIIDAKRKGNYIKGKTKTSRYIPKGYKYKPFFRIFEDYQKEDILLAVSCLKEEERKLLYKKYGENLLNIEKRDITEEETDLINFSIFKKLRLILKKITSGNYKVIGIKDLFDSDLPIDKLIEATNKAFKTNKEKIVFHFGENLDKNTIVKKENIKNVLPENIINYLINYSLGLRNIKKFFKPFVSNFESLRLENETDDELINRIKTKFYVLTEEEIKLLYRKYNEDLKNTENKRQVTKEENDYILLSIIGKLKYYLRKGNKIYMCKPLMYFFSELTTFEEVLEEINKISEEDQNLLKKKYQNNYLGITKLHELSKEENKKIINIIVKIKNRILRKDKNRSGIDMSTLRNIRVLLQTEEYEYLKSIFGTNLGAGVIIMKYMNNVCSIEEISELTKTNSGLILISTRNYLTNENLFFQKEENNCIKELAKRID